MLSEYDPGVTSDRGKIGVNSRELQGGLKRIVSWHLHVSIGGARL